MKEFVIEMLKIAFSMEILNTIVCKNDEIIISLDKSKFKIKAVNICE